MSKNFCPSLYISQEAMSQLVIVKVTVVSFSEIFPE